MFTLFGWKPGKPGPQSKILERCLRNAVWETWLRRPLPTLPTVSRQPMGSQTVARRRIGSLREPLGRTLRS